MNSEFPFTVSVSIAIVEITDPTWTLNPLSTDGGEGFLYSPPNVGKADKVEAFTLTSLKIMG